MPLSFVIARYFAYAFAAVATAWLASFMALSAAISAGFVYEASWGPANAREVAEGLAWIGNTYLDDSGRDSPASLNSTGDM